MKHEILESYLREIDHYLPDSGSAKEILREIESHILEKAERESGGMTEDSLRAAIAAYGSPRAVAAKYTEGIEIISPIFKKHLFNYTAILFAVHFVLTVIALVFNTNIIMFPWFFIPRMPVWVGPFYLAMAFVYDFGLVTLLLYFVTQKKKDARLPWPRVLRGASDIKPLGKPRVASLVALVVVFSVLLYFVVRYRTIFFINMNFGGFQPLFGGASSLYFSILILAMVACHIVSICVRFVVNSALVDLVRHAVVLIILWAMWNSPIKPEYRAAAEVLRPTAAAIVLAAAAIAAVKLIASLVRVGREMGAR